MPVVNTRTARCTIAALLFQSAFTPLAMADSFISEPDTNPRLMFYVSKAFGEKSDLQKAPQFGLRFERGIDISPVAFDHGPVFSRKISIVDLRWTRGFGQSFRLMNVPLYRSPLQLNSTEGSSAEGSASGESFGPYGTAIVWTVAALAVLCATNTILCEGDDDYQRPSDDGPSSGG